MSLHTLSLPTHSRTEILDLTPAITRLIADSGIEDGLCVVYVPHTTAAVTINENADPDVKHDLLQKLSALIPHHESYYQYAEV